MGDDVSYWRETLETHDHRKWVNGPSKKYIKGTCREWEMAETKQIHEHGQTTNKWKQ